MAKSSSSFKPGQSGNPGGRPRIANEVRTKAQAKAAQFYDVIERIALDEGGDKKLRLQAAKIGLAIAGVPMTAEDAAGAPAPQANPFAGQPTAALLQAASGPLPQ